MGLQMTLTKEHNKIYYDFQNAYWAITDLVHNTDSVSFLLEAFPTRDSKLKDRSPMEDTGIGQGFGTGGSMVRSSLYEWRGIFEIADIFPNGIPIGRDAQYTAVYNFIKQYTGLPFTDVLELEQSL